MMHYRYKQEEIMRRKLIAFTLFTIACIELYAQAPIKKKYSYEEGYADSMGYYISKALPNGWTLQRFDRRLAISRNDSVYLQFNEPLNPDYVYSQDTADYYLTLPKYKLYIYVDFPLSNWTSYNMDICKRHNDSIYKLMKEVGNKNGYYRGNNSIASYDRECKDMELLNAQLIVLPVAFTNWFGIYVSDNLPRSTEVVDSKKKHRYSTLRLPINKEIKQVKDSCVKTINTHLDIHTW
jgi:hypothetical protein